MRDFARALHRLTAIASLMLGASAFGNSKYDVVAEKACRAGRTAECTQAGNSYFRGPPGFHPDIPRAAELYTLGCRAGDSAGNSCRMLMAAGRQSEPGDPRAAADIYRHLCDFKIGDGCVELARMQHDGKGMSNDPAAALKIYRRLCQSGVSASSSNDLSTAAQGCSSLGFAYLYGDGVSKNVVRAKKLEVLSAALLLAAQEANYAEMDGIRADGERALERAQDAAAAQKRESAERSAQLIETLQQTAAQIHAGQAPGDAEMAEMHRNVAATLAQHNQRLTQERVAAQQNQQRAQQARQAQAEQQQAQQREAAAEQKQRADAQAAAAKTAAAQDAQNEARRKEAARKATLASCLGRPIAHMRTAQTNPFLSYVQQYEDLLKAAAACPAAPSAAWVDCIGMNARIWPDYDAARDFDDLHTRESNVNLHGAKGCSMNLALGGLRSYCTTMDRTLCSSNLRAAIESMQCGYATLPKVWDGEIERNDAVAERGRDDDCHQRYGY